MTSRRELILAWASLIAALTLVALTAILWTAWQHADARADRAESTVDHLTRSCDQRDDGSAECAPRAFTPLTTTTGAP